jgi:hypothetical protein
MTSLRAVIIGLLVVLAIQRGNDRPAAAFDSLRSITTLLMRDRRTEAAKFPLLAFSGASTSRTREIAVPPNRRLGPLSSRSSIV